VDAAGELEPSELRSLDALHLATLISAGEDVERAYCYDARLTDAARARDRCCRAILSDPAIDGGLTDAEVLRASAWACLRTAQLDRAAAELRWV